MKSVLVCSQKCKFSYLFHIMVSLQTILNVAEKFIIINMYYMYDLNVN